MLRRNFLILAVGILAGSLALAAPSYYPAALGDFDGAADYLSRASDLTGNADSKTGIFSAWLRKDGGDGASRALIANTSSRTLIYFLSTNKVRIVARDTSNDFVLDHSSTTTYTTSASWLHLLTSWDAGNAKSFIYVDDADVGDTPAVVVDTNIDYTGAAWAVGATATGGAIYNGAISELYFNTAEHLDLSDITNRRKFISPDGYPVDLGANGEKPTGTAPIVYMRERANNAGLNFGTGGDFTINGAPAFTEGPAGPYFPLTTEIPARGRGSRMHRQELFQ